ncbi:MAG: ribonuclease H family protein [Bacillota bacterium]
MVATLRKFLFKWFRRGSLLEIYTDGSFKEGRGAWAYVLVRDGKPLREDSASVRKTSSNRMEFQAAIEALKVLPQNSCAVVYTDSKILVDIMNNKISQWRAGAWVKSKGQPIPNVDLIKELDQYSQRHSLTWQWVRGHAGIRYNERCDELCLRARTVV